MLKQSRQFHLNDKCGIHIFGVRNRLIGNMFYIPKLSYLIKDFKYDLIKTYIYGCYGVEKQKAIIKDG